MSGDWVEAALGRMFDNGTELELLGGQNFIGFTITPNNGRYDIQLTPPDYEAEIDGAHVATSFGTPILLLGSDSGTYPASGMIRVKNNPGALWTYRAYNGDVREIISLSGNGTTFDDLAIGDGNATSGTSSTRVRAKLQVVLTVAGVDRIAVSSSTMNLGGLSISSAAKINGCQVIAPVEGSTVTTTATINVSQGNVRAVSAASAYTLTLGTTGSPLVGEGITLYCLTALANAITVANGGTGGGNIGPSGGTIPAGFKGSVTFWYDGTDWALALGSIYRVT